MPIRAFRGPNTPLGDTLATSFLVMGNAITLPAMSGTIGINAGPIGPILVTLGAMCFNCINGGWPNTTKSVYMMRNWLKMVWVYARTIPALVV